MPVENLQIERAVVHEIHLRPEGKNRIAPTYGDALMPFPPRALDTFRSRVTKAFASDSRSARMSIRDHTPESAFGLAQAICQKPEEEFIAGSCHIADRLADAQSNRNIPAGLCVVFDGTAGHPSRQFIGIMKAETHSGFQKGENLAVSFLQDLFLTPQAKLYKIGMFVAEGGDGTDFPGDWRAYLYDDRMTAARREDAATYFHDNFLGLEIPEDAALMTKRFFESAKSFIDDADLDPQSRVDLHNAVYNTLKTDQRPHVLPIEFRDNHVPVDLHDAFDRAMEKGKVPDGAFVKDTTEIRRRLRVRKLNFAHNLQLQGPSEALAEHVRISGRDIDGERWTEILIRGSLEGER